MKQKTFSLALLIFIVPFSGAFAANSGDYILDYDSLTTGGDSSASQSYFLEGGFTTVESAGESEDFKQEMLPAASVCGNGILESGEVCDGNIFNGATCRSLGFDAGNLSCDNCLSLNTTGCNHATPAPPPAGGSGGSGGGSRTNLPPGNSVPIPENNADAPSTITPAPSSVPGLPQESVHDQTPGDTNSGDDLPTYTYTPSQDQNNYNSNSQSQSPDSGQMATVKNPLATDSPPNSNWNHLFPSAPPSEITDMSGGKVDSLARSLSDQQIRDLPVASVVKEVTNSVSDIFSTLRNGLPYLSKGIPIISGIPLMEKKVAPANVQPNYERKTLITADTEPLIVGQAIIMNNAFIRVNDKNGDSISTGAIEQNDNGSFAFIPDKPLPDGEYIFQVYGLKRWKSTKIWERTVIIDRTLARTATAAQVSVSLEGAPVLASEKPTEIGSVLKKRTNSSAITGKTAPHQKLIGLLEKQSGMSERRYAAQLFSFRNKKLFPVEVTSDAEGQFEIPLPQELQIGRYSLRLASLTENDQYEYVVQGNDQAAIFIFAMHPMFEPVHFDYAEAPSLYRYTLVSTMIGLALIGLFLVFVYQRRAPRKK